MRILLVTQYFYPENFKSNDIAFELTNKGHQVDALVGIPNYPKGKIFEGYGYFKKRRENVNGVKVYRAIQIPRGRGGNFRMLLNYFSYVFFASLYVLFFFVFKKYDCIIVHEPSPITQAYPALFLKRLRRTPIYLWVLDIWPDAMISGGGIKNKKILSVVNKFVKDIYNRCDKILISSKRFTESILSKGDFSDKIVYFPNWSDDMLRRNELPSNSNLPCLPKGFRILMVGNLGKAQNLEAVMDAANKLRANEEVKWIFVGDGSMKKWIDQYILDNQLQKTVFTLGRFPADTMPYFFEEADALLLTLKSGFPHLKMVVPARLQSYMSAGKPILGMIDGGAEDIINEAKCGYTVSAGNSDELVGIIEEKILNNLFEWKNMGKYARAYYEKEFTKEVCINNLEKIISNE